MIWAAITRLNDIFALIGVGTCAYGLVRFTTFLNRRRARG